jgi:hypothetical protein
MLGNHMLRELKHPKKDKKRKLKRPNKSPSIRNVVKKHRSEKSNFRTHFAPNFEFLCGPRTHFRYEAVHPEIKGTLPGVFQV